MLLISEKKTQFRLEYTYGKLMEVGGFHVLYSACPTPRIYMF